MRSPYLDVKEYGQFGLPADTPDSRVLEASAFVDEILMRAEGLVWMPDANGAPAYMAGLTPRTVLQLTAAVAPGADVVVPIQPAIAIPDMVGEVVILDRGSKTAVEACIISGVSADRASVTLAVVQFGHAAGGNVEFGLTIEEERPVAANRQIARVSRTPVAAMLSLQGRYGYGRRSDQIAGRYADASLLALAQPFGGPAPWNPVPVAMASVSSTTGQVFVPAGLYMAAFSDVRMRYLAGYSVSAVPNPVKIATARIALSLTADEESGISSSIKMYRAGNTAFTRFSPSSLDPDTMRLLSPYKALTFF